MRKSSLILSILLIFITISNLEAQRNRKKYEYRRTKDISINAFPKNIRRGKLILKGTYNKTQLKGLKIYQETASGLAKSVKVYYQNNRYRAVLNFTKKGKYTVEIGKVYKSIGWQMGLLTKISVGASNKNISMLPFKNFTRTKDVQNYTKTFFVKLNELRRRYHLPAFIWDDKLAKIALSHSKVCVKINLFAHVTPLDKTPRDRGKTVGYNSIGENMAGGTTPESALNALFSSIAHRNSILSATYTKAGIGVAKRGSSYIVTVNFLNESSQYRFKKQYQKALSVLLKQLDVIKRSAWNSHIDAKQSVLRGIGYIYYKLKNYEKALKKLEEAYLLNHSNISTAKILAYCYRKTNQYDNAIKLFKSIQKSEPSEKKMKDQIKLSYYLWARFYDKKKDYKNANKIYKKILSLFPKYFIAVKMYAYHFYRQKKYSEAIAIYRKAVKLKAFNQKEKKDIKGFYFNIAYCYFKLKDYQKAAKQFKRNINIYPREVKNYRYLSSCYNKEKNYLSSVLVLKKAVKKFPFNQKVKDDLKRAFKSYAYSFYKEKKYKEAAEIYHKILKSKIFDQKNEKDVKDFYFKIAYCYFKLKDYQKAAKQFKRNINIYPREVKNYRYLSSCYNKEKNYLNSVLVLKKAVSIFSGNKSVKKDLSRALKSYAYSFYKAKKYEKAIFAFKDYLKYYPKEYVAYRSLGWCYYRKKNYSLSSRYFKRALALKSDDKSSQNGLKSSLKKLAK